jgi:hypothetical protein
MSDGRLLDRAELERVFAALGDRLVRRGVVADIFIVGGAAMALAYDADRVTRDVDATFVPHGVVLEEARNVADAMGLPQWWLNEQAQRICVDTQRRREAKGLRSSGDSGPGGFPGARLRHEGVRCAKPR